MYDILRTVPTAWTDNIIFAQWIVKRIHPEIIVDLGIDKGYSTFCFSSPNIGHVYGIDSFEPNSKFGYDSSLEYVTKKKNEMKLDNVTIIKGFFNNIAETWDKEIDILHIDGDHSYESVKNDYETWTKFLKKDSVILFHDVCVEELNGSIFGVKKFFEELEIPKLIFPVGYGLGVASEDENLINEIKENFVCDY